VGKESQILERFFEFQFDKNLDGPIIGVGSYLKIFLRFFITLRIKNWYFLNPLGAEFGLSVHTRLGSTEVRLTENHNSLS